MHETCKLHNFGQQMNIEGNIVNHLQKQDVWRPGSTLHRTQDAGSENQDVLAKTGRLATLPPGRFAPTLDGLPHGRFALWTIRPPRKKS